MTHVVSVSEQPAASVTVVDDPTSIDTALTNVLVSTVAATTTVGVSPYTIIDQSTGGGTLDGSLSWRASGSHSAGATTITLDAAPLAVGANTGFVIIDPYTTEAEIRKVSSVGATSFTVSSGLTYAHSAGDPILWFPGGLVPWTWFGGKGSGSTGDATNNVLSFNRLSDQLYNLSTYFRGGILIPQGNFYINDELHPERDMMLSGVNVQNSKITCTTDFPFDGSDNIAMIRAKRDGSIVSMTNLVSGRWFFRDFYVDGNNVANSNGIFYSPQQPDRLSDMRIDNCKGYGLLMADVQQHVIQNLEQINCGTAMKFARGVRMLHCNSWNVENPDLHALHVTSTTGDGNCSRWNKFENTHFETHDDTAGVWMLVDPTNASSPDNSNWIFDNGLASFRGTETFLKFLGSSIPNGYTLRNWRFNGDGGGVIAIDDAWQAKQWMGLGDFNDRIEEFHSVVVGSSSSTFPVGVHAITVARSGGQQARVGVPAAASSFPASNFTSNIGTNANVHHYEARNTAGDIIFRVNNDGGLVVGTSGTPVKKILHASASLNFGSIAANTSATLTVTVTGATANMVAHASPAAGIETGLVWSAHVSATDTVTVTLANVTVAAIDPGSRSWRVVVEHF